MNQEPNSEAAETVQTTNVPAVDLPRLVRHSSELLENLEAWAEEFRSQQHGVTLSLLRAIRRIKDLEGNWTQTPPKETGLYWLWQGDDDSAAVPVQVYSNDHESWVAPGQYGWNRAQTMDELANSWWMPVQDPSLPNAAMDLPGDPSGPKTNSDVAAG